MTKVNIDLGKSMEGLSVTSPAEIKRSEKFYPRFTYDSDEEMKLPKEGKMTVEYCKVGSEELTDSEGKTRYTCTIEVREIESIEADEYKEPASNRGRETEDALDKLVAAVKSKY